MFIILKDNNSYKVPTSKGVMVIAATFGPRINPHTELENIMWEPFHFEVLHLRDRKALDKLIRIVDNQIKSISKKPYIQYNYFDEKGIITDYNIARHFDFYMLRTTRELRKELSSDEANKFVWNLAKNILRGLKEYRNDTFFLLPDQDKKDTLDFIETLKQNPDNLYWDFKMVW